MINHKEITGHGYEGEAEDINYDEIESQTDNSVSFVFRGHKVLVPKSLIQGIEEDRVWIAAWFAKKENLI